MRDKLNIWYVYAYDSEGDFVLIKQKHYTATTTDIPENASNYYEIVDARNCINWIKKGIIELTDDMVDPNDLKIAYIDKYGNLYDNELDKCVYINDDGDEISESKIMDLKEAKQVLNENGFYLTEFFFDDDEELAAMYKNLLKGRTSNSKYPIFKKKQELIDWCEKQNPEHNAVWVADTMNAYARIGKYKMYDWVQSWAIKNHIDYDNAYINALGGY